jgi:hypothetical protein
MTSSSFACAVCFLLFVVQLLAVDTHKKLQYKLSNRQYEKKYITDFAESARCPFKVLRLNDTVRVICDFTNCTDGCHNCEQAYVYLGDIKPAKGCGEELSNQTKIEMGCIYVPKRGEQSKETGPVSPSVT